MKFVKTSFVSVLVLLVLVVNANITPKDLKPPVVYKMNSRIETIGEHAFFILNLSKKGIELNYGDKVELIFGFNNSVIVYNISGSETTKYTNKNELVAFIDPEYLRCFKRKNLKKIIIYSGDESIIIKTNIPANQLEIK